MPFYAVVKEFDQATLVRHYCVYVSDLSCVSEGASGLLWLPCDGTEPLGVPAGGSRLPSGLNTNSQVQALPHSCRLDR